MESAYEKVVVRFAPSPTGNLHVGSARTALFNWLYAKQHGGKALLRLEDTDKARSQPIYEANIYESLEWLGLSFDEQNKQSERGDIYRKYIAEIIGKDAAYVSKEPSREDASREVEVVRIRNPGSDITFYDKVRGDITFNTAELGDFVLARSVDDALYHLAVVVDDHEMGVTHVIRGEDHISNTPRQILIQQAIGAKRPAYVHLPLLLAPDRSKLSKRHGAVSVTEYREMGVLAEALNNYLALLGWSPGNDREVFSREDLIKEFSINKIQKSGAVFSVEKLSSLNRKHITNMSAVDFLREVEVRIPDNIKKLSGYSIAILERAVEVLREHISVFSDITKDAERGDLNWMFDDPVYDAGKLSWRDETDDANTKKHLKYAIDALTEMKAENFSASSVRNAMWDYASVQGRGAVLWPMRYALTGLDKSPDPFSVAFIVGKETTIRRLAIGIDRL